MAVKINVISKHPPKKLHVCTQCGAEGWFTPEAQPRVHPEKVISRIGADVSVSGEDEIITAPCGGEFRELTELEALNVLAASLAYRRAQPSVQ